MTNIRATAPTETAKPAAAGPGPRRWGALLPLALGGCLLVFGLPRLVSAVTMLPGAPVIDALRAEQPLSDEELDGLARRWSIARQFSSSGRIAAELADAKLAAAERLPSRAQSKRRGLVEEAATLLEEGLAAAPADSFAWARLAYARNLKDGLGPGAVDAWRLSVLTAPADRRLALWRTRFGIALVSRLIEDDQALLDGQIRFAWRSDQAELARYAKAAGPGVVRAVRAALFDRPEDLQRFDSLIR